MRTKYSGAQAEINKLSAEVLATQKKQADLIAVLVAILVFSVAQFNNLILQD